MLLADRLCLANSDVFGQGILGLVREKSVKSQGILCSIVCGNPELLTSAVYLRILEASGVFLGLIWGRISATSNFKNEQKLFKMMYVVPNFLLLHFGENFMKIQTKIAKLQMHENLHKM